jgi:biopolymer transport protein ExbD
MPKHKIARKSTAVDMTAMCDVSFLLLTFFMLATKFKPPDLIETINRDKNLGLTAVEKRNFSLSSGIGVPFNQLKALLKYSPAEQKQFKSTGIPVDTVLTDNNELFKWVAYGRISNPKARLSIKGDGGAKYPVVRAVFATLANKKVQGHKFYAVTSLKADPNKPEDEK